QRGVRKAKKRHSEKKRGQRQEEDGDAEAGSKKTLPEGRHAIVSVNFLHCCLFSAPCRVAILVSRWEPSQRRLNTTGATGRTQRDTITPLASPPAPWIYRPLADGTQPAKASRPRPPPRTQADVATTSAEARSAAWPRSHASN